LNKVKFAVIGLGWFGQKHCEVLSSLSHVELYALCTRTESRLRELGERFQVKHLYTDYQQLLNNNEIDAVSVVTMWNQHLEPTLASLEAGKHVFLEKPMASSVADAEKIVAATKETSKFLMVGHICRFNPRYAAAKAAIEEGRIGRIVSMYARRNIPETVGAAVLPKIGPIIGDGVHDTDLMLWYSGTKIKSVYAQTLSIRNFPHPDLAWTLYRFDSGAIGVCENIWFLPEKTAFQIDERMEIIGTQGSIHIQETHPNFSICDSNGWHSSDTTYWPLLHGVRSGALREELSYFATCILENRKPTIIQPEESLEAVRACLAAEESAQKGQIIIL